MLLDDAARPAASRARLIPIIGSLSVHALLIAWLSAPPWRQQPSAYDQLIRPHEDHLVWYSFKKKLPDVSPAKSSAGRRPLRAEVKLEKQSIVSAPKDAPKADQMIFHPVPALKPQPITPLPNLIALSAPPPPRTPATVTAPAPAPELQAALKVPEVYRLPAAQKPFTPPPQRTPAPKLALHIQTVEAPELRPGEQVLSLEAQNAMRQGSRTLAFRPSEKPSLTASVGAMPNAPVIENASNSAANVAVVGLNPIDDARVKLPESSRSAQFSGGPKLNPDGATSSGKRSGVAVPDLTVRGGDRQAAATLLARAISPAYNSPTSPEGLRAAARENSRAMPLEEQTRPSGTRVSGAPDPRFQGREVFSVAIQMPNLTSYVGSWLMWYAGRDSVTVRTPISSPEPLHKVDPKYLPGAVEERIEGTVRLAFVIGKDGHVYDVETVRGIDERLDRSAAEALRKWVFQPATRQGAPVDVDALVEIPFRLAPRALK